MRLIETSEEGLPVYSPEARTIKEFSLIIRRDRSKENDKNGRKKDIATKELAFVHFWCVFDSRYNLYDDIVEKSKRIADDVDLPKGWEPDQVVVDAINKYKDLITTRSSNLINRSDQLIKKMETFLDNLDLEAITTTGAYKFPFKQAQDAVKNMPEMIESLQKAEKLVRKELEEQTGKKLRDDIGMFEQKGFKIDKTKPL